METKHTTGEWLIHEKAAGNVIQKDTGRVVANCRAYTSNVNPHLVDEENMANAKLIAAAPDLLEALSELIDINESEEVFDIKVNRMVNALSNSKEAIKKATE